MSPEASLFVLHMATFLMSPPTLCSVHMHFCSLSLLWAYSKLQWTRSLHQKPHFNLPFFLEILTRNMMAFLGTRYWDFDIKFVMKEATIHSITENNRLILHHFIPESSYEVFDLREIILILLSSLPSTKTQLMLYYKDKQTLVCVQEIECYLYHPERNCCGEKSQVMEFGDETPVQKTESRRLQETWGKFTRWYSQTVKTLTLQTLMPAFLIACTSCLWIPEVPGHGRKAASYMFGSTLQSCQG